MADLQKLLFETKARVTDREILATARLNARVKVFAGQVLDDDVLDRINAAIGDEMDRLVADGVLRQRADWLAVLVRRRLHVAFGSRAVQQLCRELKEMGAT
jgi:phage-related baseplate assembly protein